MRLLSSLRNLVRIALGVLLCAGVTVKSFAQQAEVDPTYYDENLQPVDLKEYADPQLDIKSLNSGSTPEWYSMITKLPGDYARTGNLLIRSESIPAAAGIGLLTFSLTRVDNQLWRATRKFYRSSKTTNMIGSYAVALGDGRFHLGIAAAFAGYGWLADDSRALQTASQTAEAFLATGIAVQILKHITGRQSPAAATRQSGRWKFFPHMKQYDKHPTSYYAFPSGHISTAMATLTVVAENYPEQRWLRPVGYTLVGVLGTGLVAKGMHWYSDLPLGIAIGYVFGKVAASPLMPGQPTASDHEDGVKVAVSPEFSGQGGAGIHLALAF